MVRRHLLFWCLSALAELCGTASTTARLFVVLGGLASTGQALGRCDALSTHFDNELGSCFVCECLWEQFSCRIRTVIVMVADLLA